MNSQTTQITNLPDLSPAALVRLRSRLDQSLLRLAELTELALERAPLALPPAEKGLVNVNSDDSWTNIKPTSSERRAFPRRDSNCKVAVCRFSSENDSLTSQEIEWRFHGTSIKGTLSDLSLNGAAIVLREPLPIEETVVLRLFSPLRDKHLDRQAIVLRNLPEAGKSKVICQFTQKLSLEQVSYFSRFLNDSEWIS